MRTNNKNSGYFAILRDLMGYPMPHVDEDGNLLIFSDSEACRLSADSTGNKFGFKVYFWGPDETADSCAVCGEAQPSLQSNF